MKTAQAITFRELLDSIDSRRPLNLEHIQARAYHVSCTVIQIITDDDFPLAIVRSFPRLIKPETATVDQIGEYWDRFDAWMDSLPAEIRLRIEAAQVIA